MVITETARLVVRTLIEADFPHIFRLQSDPASMRYIRTPVRDEAVVRERMVLWEDYRRRVPGLGVFAVEDKADGSFAGYVTARHVDFNPDTGEFEVGYVIVPERWGQGLAGELVPPLCRYLFGLSGAPYIVAFTDPDNLASQRVLLKSGFREVGRRQVYDGESKEFRLE